jgi:CBS domain-containing protein
MSLVTTLALVAGVVIGIAVESGAGGEQLVDAVFIATGENYPDALAASAATDDQGPILLVTHNSIPEPTEDELVRLNPKRIVVVGGTAVISAQVEADLGAFTTGDVIRLSGANRYETAADISAATFPITGAASCAGRAFLPDNTPSASNYGFVDGRRVGTGLPGSFSCPVSLPDGQIQCSLKRVDLTGGFNDLFLGAVDTLATGATLDIEDAGFKEVVDSTITFAGIDTTRFAYWVECSMSNDSNQLGVYGVTVRYRN